MSGSDPRASQPARRRFGGPLRFSLGATTFVVKGVPAFDLHDPYYFAVSLSWQMFVLVFVGAELAINLGFAVLYWLVPGSVANAAAGGFTACFFFSLETLATVGYGNMYPSTLYGHVVSGVEILIGVVFTAIMTGLLFVRFTKPKAKVLYAKHAVVTRHNGTPTLMFRIGNGRRSMLHDATINLHMLLRNVSQEGTSHAAIVELPLMRSRIPVFAIVYLMMHVIDESSPLFGLDQTSPELLATRFFLTVVARDPAVGAQVSDIHTFEGDTVRFGMRYADAVSSRGQKVVADYTKLSELISAPLGNDAPSGHLSGDL